MPAERVLATQQARDAAKQLLARAGSVKEQVGRVLQHGGILADPTHWGGGLAGKWRNDWGQDASRLKQAAAKLDELEHRAHQVVEDIFKADNAPGSAPMGVVADKSPHPPQTKEKDQGLLGDIGGFFGGAGNIVKHFGEGFWDGAVGFVAGLAGLIGRDPTTGKWSWGAAGNAWKGLGTFAAALGAYGTPEGIGLDQTVGYPGFKRGELGNTLLGAGKGLIAYDEWGKDPARAAGTVTFNILSAVIGTKGAGSGLRLARAARVSSAAVRLFDKSVQDGLKVKLNNPVTHDQFPSNYDPLHGLSPRQYLDRYSKGVDANGRTTWDWGKVPKDGAIPGTEVPTELPVGKLVDRYGFGKAGQFLSPVDTPFPARSLPADRVTFPYHQYEVIKPLPATEGVVARAFGEPGGGLQYKLEYDVNWYVREGYLREVPQPR